MDVTPNWLDFWIPRSSTVPHPHFISRVSYEFLWGHQSKQQQQQQQQLLLLTTTTTTTQQITTTKRKQTKPNQPTNDTTIQPTNQPNRNQTTKQQRPWLLKPRNKLDFVPTKHLSLPLIQPQTSTGLWTPKQLNKNRTDRKGYIRRNKKNSKNIP